MWSARSKWMWLQDWSWLHMRKQFSSDVGSTHKLDNYLCPDSGFPTKATQTSPAHCTLYRSLRVLAIIFWPMEWQLNIYINSTNHWPIERLMGHTMGDTAWLDIIDIMCLPAFIHTAMNVAGSAQNCSCRSLCLCWASWAVLNVSSVQCRRQTCSPGSN